MKRCIDNEIQKSGLHDARSEALSSKMAEYIVMSKSDSTNSKYFNYFKKWDKYISSKGGSAIPASPIHIALYLTKLMDKHTSSAVISSTVYSIRWAHLLKNLPDPTKNTFVSNLVEASKRFLSKPVCKKEPITSDVLVALCEKYSDSADLLVIRDLRMILIAFSGFLRFDDLSSLHSNDIKFHDNYLSVYSK